MLLIVFNGCAAALSIFLLWSAKTSADVLPSKGKLQQTLLHVETHRSENTGAALVEMINGADSLMRFWISAARRLVLINITVSAVNLIVLALLIFKVRRGNFPER